MIGGIHLTDPLLSNSRRAIHTDTWTVGGIMKYAVEMGSGAIMYIPSFIKIDSGIQKLIGRIHRHSMEIASSFQNKESRQKINCSLVCSDLDIM
jgi:hypothetical protein